MLKPFDHAYVHHDLRRYYAIEGHILPGVTTILGATKPLEQQRALDRWREGKTEEQLSEGRDRGTCVHSMIEMQLCEKFEYLPAFDLKAFLKATSKGIYQKAQPYYKSLIPVVDTVEKVHLMESATWYDDGDVAFAGKPDLLAEFKGKGLQLADWKTSARRKTGYQVRDYRIQAVMYLMALNQRYNLDLMDATVYIGYSDGGYEQFSVNQSNFSDYWDEAVSRIYQFQAMMIN